MARISPPGPQIANQPPSLLLNHAGAAGQCPGDGGDGWFPPKPSSAATSDHLASALTLSHTFPATPDQVRAARRFLAAALIGCPAAGDALVCLSELVTNAICHSRSARPGGRFGVRVSRAPSRLQVEVTDEGGPWAPQSAGDEHGHGLAIVTALVTHVRITDLDRDSPARTVTFEMSLH